MIGARCFAVGRCRFALRIPPGSTDAFEPQERAFGTLLLIESYRLAAGRFPQDSCLLATTERRTSSMLVDNSKIG
jgi:hypothetical protein